MLRCLSYLPSILGDWIQGGYPIGGLEDNVMSEAGGSIDRILNDFIEKENDLLFGDDVSAAETAQSPSATIQTSSPLLTHEAAPDAASEPYSVPLASFFDGTDEAEGLAKLPKPYRMRMYEICFRLVARVLYLEDSIKLSSHRRFRDCLRQDREAILAQASREAPKKIPTTEGELAEWCRFASVRRNVLLQTAESEDRNVRKRPVNDYGQSLGLSGSRAFRGGNNGDPAFAHKSFTFHFCR